MIVIFGTMTSGCRYSAVIVYYSEQQTCRRVSPAPCSLHYTVTMKFRMKSSRTNSPIVNDLVMWNDFLNISYCVYVTIFI